MNAQDADRMATMVTQCYASTQGCKRLPVRMVVEIPTKPDIDGADGEFVMLCTDHAATYVPTGTVVSDSMVVTDEANLKMLRECGL